MADELDRPGDAERHDAGSHFPGPSIWPFGFALGIAFVLLGLIVEWWLAAIGAVIAVIFGFLWIREATREVRGEEAPPPSPAVAAEVPADEAEGSPRYTRSVFLEATTLGLGAAITGIVTLPVLGFAVLPAFVDQGYESVDLGPLESFPEGQWVVTKFISRQDQPADVSRRTAYVRNNGEKDGQPSFTIISNRCVHLGCPVQPTGLTEEPREVETKAGPVEVANTNPSGFACPCHGGAYDTEGNRTAGPPVRSLDRYTYSIQGGNLILTEPYSVGSVQGEGADAVMESYSISDPGVHVDGPEQYFYPYVP